MGEQDEETMFLSISDNGLGFPEGEDKTSLTEPYVTHKTKGTGLGLAIVKKIMEDHNGKIILGAPEWLRERKEWTDLGGATTLLILPLEPAEEKQ